MILRYLRHRGSSYLSTTFAVARDDPPLSETRRTALRLACGLLLLGGVLPTAAIAQTRPLVLRNATILTGDGTRLDHGAVAVQSGKITAVGEDVEAPMLARTLKLKGKFITPGLIDVHTTFDLDAFAGGGQAVARAADAFDAYDADALKAAFEQGLTALYVPARKGGLGSVVRLHPGAGDDHVLKADAAYCAVVPSDPGQGPLVRLRVTEDLRRQFKGARDYREAWQEYDENLKEYEKKLAERVKKEADEAKATPPDKAPDKGPTDKPTSQGKKAAAEPPKPEPDKDKKDAKPDEKKDELKKPQEPGKDRNTEVLLRVLDGELLLRVEANDPADILNVLDLAEEYNVGLVIEGAAGAHEVVAALAKRHTPVVLSAPPPSVAFTPGALRWASDDTAARLARAGVPVYIGSGAVPNTGAPRLSLALARAAGHGFEADNLLSVVTSRAATLLGVDKEIGRLAPGLKADLVVWSHHPFAPGAKVERVFVGGVEVYHATGSDDDD